MEKEIRKEDFENWKELEEIVIPDSVTTILFLQKIAKLLEVKSFLL